MGKALTVAQLKKKLDGLDKDEITNLVLDLYKSSAAVKDALNIRFSAEYGEELLEKAMKKLDKAFSFNRVENNTFSIREGKEVVANFVKTCPDNLLAVKINLHFVKCAVDFTNEYGDMDEVFYDALVNHFETITEIISIHPEFNDVFIDELEQIVDDCDFGWGVQEELSELLENLPSQHETN